MRSLAFIFGLSLAALTYWGAQPVSAQANAQAQILLINNASTSSAAVTWPGGIGVFEAVGTFNGATVTLELLGPDGVTYVATGTATTCTAACASVFYLPRSTIKAFVSGAGGSTALYVSVQSVPNLIG